MTKRYFTLTDAAKSLGVSERTLGRLRQAMGVVTFALGRKTYLTAYEVERVRRERREKVVDKYSV